MGFECIICNERLEDPAPERNISTSPKKAPTRGRTRSKKPPTQFTATDIVSYKCGHCFHTSCIEDWFASTPKRECPSCRGLCPPRDMRKMYPSKDDSFIEPHQPPLTVPAQVSAPIQSRVTTGTITDPILTRLPTSTITASIPTRVPTSTITASIPTRVPTSTITAPGYSIDSLGPTLASIKNHIDHLEHVELRQPQLQYNPQPALFGPPTAACTWSQAMARHQPTNIAQPSKPSTATSASGTASSTITSNTNSFYEGSETIGKPIRFASGLQTPSHMNHHHINVQKSPSDERPSCSQGSNIFNLYCDDLCNQDMLQRELRRFDETCEQYKRQNEERDRAQAEYFQNIDYYRRPIIGPYILHSQHFTGNGEGPPLSKIPRKTNATSIVPGANNEIPTSSTNMLNHNAGNTPGASGSAHVNFIPIVSPKVRRQNNSTIYPVIDLEEPSNNTPPSGAADPTLHETLIADFKQLREQYNSLKEEMDLKTVLLVSAQEHNTRLENELKEIKERGTLKFS